MNGLFDTDNFSFLCVHPILSFSAPDDIFKGEVLLTCIPKELLLLIGVVLMCLIGRVVITVRI